jgi:hypothetical protein
MTKFRKNLDKYNMKKEKLPLLVKNTAESNVAVPAMTLPHRGTTTDAPLSPNIIFDDPLLKVGIKDFLLNTRCNE